MLKVKNDFRERRRYVRLKTPVELSYFPDNEERVSKAVAENISADGLRFRTKEQNINEGDSLELKLILAGAANPVHAKANVVWKKKVSLEDGAPFDIGLEFTSIEEDNKNTFLKNLCDLIYNMSENHAGGKGKDKCSE